MMMLRWILKRTCLANKTPTLNSCLQRHATWFLKTLHLFGKLRFPIPCLWSWGCRFVRQNAFQRCQTCISKVPHVSNAFKTTAANLFIQSCIVPYLSSLSGDWKPHSGDSNHLMAYLYKGQESLKSLNKFMRKMYPLREEKHLSIMQILSSSSWCDSLHLSFW